MEHADIRDAAARLDEQVGRIVVGQSDTLQLLTVALLSQGHVLLEGNPGTGKTLLTRAFAASLGLQFKRIQFTPDLMPGDVIGTNLFDFQTSRFTLVKGPIFTEFLLADEINRTPPKTQSALLEAMQERRVTIDGASQPLSPGFMVVATQNPIEHEGTYPLPEAQLDRFLFKVLVAAPARDEELAMVRLHGHQAVMPDIAAFGLAQVCDLAFLSEARQLVGALRLADPMVEYVVDLVRATRDDPSLLHGASPRSANMLATAARALAVLLGRDFVIPDDVKFLYPAVMRHRVVLAPGAEVEGRTTDEVLSRILNAVPAPR